MIYLLISPSNETIPVLKTSLRRNYKDIVNDKTEFILLIFRNFQRLVELPSLFNFKTLFIRYGCLKNVSRTFCVLDPSDHITSFKRVQDVFCMLWMSQRRPVFTKLIKSFECFIATDSIS